MSSNLDQYERIAPLYDPLDLPFEYSRYRKIRPLLFQGLRLARLPRAGSPMRRGGRELDP